MKLPEPPGLWPFVPEHGTGIAVFLRPGVGGSVVFDECPNRSGRPFRSQGQGGAVAIREGIHLLLNDVRRRAYTAGK